MQPLRPHAPGPILISPANQTQLFPNQGPNPIQPQLQNKNIPPNQAQIQGQTIGHIPQNQYQGPQMPLQGPQNPQMAPNQIMTHQKQGQILHMTQNPLTQVPNQVIPHIPLQAVQNQVQAGKQVTQPICFTLQLLNYCNARGWGVPRYVYNMSAPGMVRAQVTMPDGRFVTGEDKPNKPDAGESAARNMMNFIVQNNHQVSSFYILE